MELNISSIGYKNRLLAKLVPGLNSIHLGPIVIGLDNFYYHLTKESKCYVSPHTHGWYEFSQPLCGVIDYSFGEGHCRLNKDGMLLLPAGLVHEWRARHSPIVISSFLLQIRPIDAAGKAILQSLHEYLEKNNYAFKRTALAHYLESTIWGTIRKDSSSPLLRERLHALLRLYIVESFQAHFSHLFPDPEFGSLKESNLSENEVLVEQIMSYVGSNIGRSLRLEELATHFHFSPRHLNRVFKEQTGQAIGVYVLTRRLQEACDRLVNTNHPIKRIAYELGFKDSSYFCRFFRSEIGYTPNQYRMHQHGTVGQPGNSAAGK